MRWLIDSDVLIEGEREHPGFVPWLESIQQVATADIIRCEFLLGVYAVSDAAKRFRGQQFYRNYIAKLPSFPNEPFDYGKAAQIAGEVRRQGKGKPSIADGLLAVIALRTGTTVATRNLTDFIGMGCPCQDPLLKGPVVK